MNIYQKTFIAFSIVSTIVALCFVPWAQVRIYLTPLPATVQEQADDLIEHGIDGIIVYVDKQGQAPKFYVSGWHDRDSRTLVDPQAVFKIASITKLYVAAVVAILANSQDLPLERSLAEYLPALNGRIENADRITLAMLVQHRSGIPNYSDISGYRWFDPSSEKRSILDVIAGQPADFEPDSQYSYSNTNYYLIGEIIQATLGHDYQHFIQQEILDPLGLTHTYTSMDEVNMDDLMSGYTIEYDGDLKEVNHTGAMGSMLATAQDVGIFLRALNDGSLLSEPEQAVYSSIYVYEHTGLLPGYSSIARYHENIDTVVIQFVNTSGTHMWGIMDVNYKRIVRILRRQES